MTESETLNMLMNICDHLGRNQLLSGRCDLAKDNYGDSYLTEVRRRIARIAEAPVVH